MLWLLAAAAVVGLPVHAAQQRASGPAGAEAQNAASKPAASSATGEAADMAPSAPVSPDYRIGPGDVLQIFVWRNPELTVSVPVRPDGKISTPLVDDLVAVGKSPTQLARDLEAVLSEYIRSPKVNVIVTQAASIYNQVRIMGQVRTPQSIAHREGMTLLDAVMAAGGLTEFAAGDKAYLLRKGEDGKDVRTRLKIEALLKGRIAENSRLMPGDVIVVPESWF